MAFSDAGRIGFVIKGNYDATATYEFLDVVYSNNATYIARKVTTGDPVTDTTAWFCALNANLNGMVHSATINPSASAPFAADWLMENGAVITPQSNDLYRVLVEGKERLYFWNGTQYETLSGGGHTIQNTSGTALEQRDNLQFKDMAVSDDSTNNKTIIRQTQVVATKAEWDAMTPDPNVTYYLPWMEMPAIFRNGEYYGTNNQIDDNQVSANTTWSSNKINGDINTKVNKSDIANNVTTTTAGKVLDARQGKTLQDGINTVETQVLALDTKLNKLKTLKGKTIIVLGDSLTEGSLNSYHNTWVEMLAKKYECTTYNYGLSGSPIASTSNDSMISRLPAILNEHNTCDVFILSGGANDKNRSIPLGSSNSDNNSQVIGAVKNIFKAVRSKYGEDCLLLGMTTYHRYQDSYNAPAADTAPNALGLREYDYVDAVMRACNAISVPCFNNYDNCGISLATQEVNPNYNSWCDSGIEAGQGRSYHLSVKAYEYLTPIYAQFIANGYTNCGTTPPVYNTVDNILWSKTKLNNGLALVTGRFYIDPTWTTLGDHIAIYNPNAFTIPKGYQLTDILSANVSLRNDGSSTFGTISGLTNTSSGSSLTMRFVNIFGKSTTSVRIYAFVSIIGFDNGI